MYCQHWFGSQSYKLCFPARVTQYTSSYLKHGKRSIMIAHCNPIINFDLLAPLAGPCQYRYSFSFLRDIFKNVCFLP